MCSKSLSGLWLKGNWLLNGACGYIKPMPLFFFILGFASGLHAGGADSLWSPLGKIMPLYDSVEQEFQNPFPSEPRPKRSFWDKLKSWNSHEGYRQPESYLRADSVDMNLAFPQDSEGLFVTWMGHSSVLIQMDGVRILLDPVFTQQVSPVPWIRSIRRFQEQAPAALQKIPSVDVIFLSHDHYDHLDKEAVLQLAGRTQWFAVPLGVRKRLLDWGVDSSKVREYNWWQEDSLQTPSGKTIHFACTPAKHFSGRSLWDRNSTLWASWVLKGAVHRLFYSGDTGYASHFTQIGSHYGPFDLTLMECGQYNDLWKGSHMFPEQTVQAHLEVKGRWLLPVHWGAFSLSSHAWFDPAERVEKASMRHGVALLTPRVGQTLAMDDEPFTTAWWKSWMPQENASR